MTHQEVIKELERELATRHSVYPNWIRANKIKKEVAAHRIAALEHAIKIIKSQIPQQLNLEL